MARRHWKGLVLAYNSTTKREFGRGLFMAGAAILMLATLFVFPVVLLLQ